MARYRDIVFCLTWLNQVAVSRANTSSGQTMQRLSQFDGGVRQSASPVVHPAVPTAGKCGLLCDLHGVSGCDHFIYNDVTKDCAVCAVPCASGAGWVFGQGLRVYRQLPSCPTEKGYYEYYHNASSRKCLRLELDNAAHWTTAQDNCQQDGGHLADFETDQEFNDITDYIGNVHSDGFPSGTFVLLGAYKDSGQWTWWDHSTIAPSILDGKWESYPNGQEPSNDPSELYLAIRVPTMALHDYPAQVAERYLCEIDLTA